MKLFLLAAGSGSSQFGFFFFFLAIHIPSYYHTNDMGGPSLGSTVRLLLNVDAVDQFLRSVNLNYVVHIPLRLFFVLQVRDFFAVEPMW